MGLVIIVKFEYFPQVFLEKIIFLKNLMKYNFEFLFPL
jgi:hypothetical protein